MRAEYSVRITPADVGRRVSVRSRLTGPGPTTTDTVGRLQSWSADALTIKRRDGTIAVVAVGDLLAGKVIPEQPPRRPRYPEGAVDDGKGGSHAGDESDAPPRTGGSRDPSG